jgi:hypothetical protein
VFSIWPTCENCGQQYELSEYELNHSLHIPKLVFCSECHQVFTLEPEEITSIREIMDRTMTSNDPWDDDVEESFPPLWNPGVPDELEAAQLVQLAQSGNTMAMLVLGALYCEGGFGLKQDFDQARFWWRLARDAGESEALECLKHLEKELPCPVTTDDSLEVRLPPHWFALREIHTNNELPISFTEKCLDHLLRLDYKVFGAPTIDGQRPDMVQEHLQKQDSIVYEAVRQALPDSCQDCYKQFLSSQFDLEYSLLIQDFPEATEAGERKLGLQQSLSREIFELGMNVKVEVEHLRRGLDLLNIEFLS